VNPVVALLLFGVFAVPWATGADPRFGGGELVETIRADTIPPDTVPGESIRDVMASIPVPALQFSPPRATETSVSGVPLFHIEDRSLPLVRLMARFERGYGHLDREWFGAATLLPLLLRGGGSVGHSPDSVEVMMEGLAAETTFGGSGTSTTSSLDVVKPRLGAAAALWTRLLTHPDFEANAVENRRGREVEGLLRADEDPGRLAVVRFNRLMFGDHFIGWDLAPEDLTPERVNPERLERVAASLLCRDRLVLGAVGALTEEEAKEVLRPLVEGLPPCAELGTPPAPPSIRPGPQVVLVPHPTQQSVIVMGKGSTVVRDTTQRYFAAQVANSILGGGGFSSRILARVRTEEGLAYGASSFWTIPSRGPGVIGAMTRTGGDRTVEAMEVLSEVLEDAGERPPTPDEVATVVDQVVHSFVFGFETPDQIVSRSMSLRSQGLTQDWLMQYTRGIAAVEPEQIGAVLAQELRTDELVILVVGDPSLFDEGLSEWGPVTRWDLEDEPPAWLRPSGPRGSPRSLR
jgi:zinc protease